jgi:hypothetical protein
MSNTHEYEGSQAEYQVRIREGRDENTVQHRRSSSTRRRHSAPQSFNGIHRRRRRKADL